MRSGFEKPTPAHQAVMDADHDRRVEAALQNGLELRGKCERVLNAKTMAEAVAADDALMLSEDGDVCPCAMARQIIDALNAERREALKEAASR